jgi:vitamin B12 transporter
MFCACVPTRRSNFQRRLVSLCVSTSLVSWGPIAAFAQDASITSPPVALPPVVVKIPANPEKKQKKATPQAAAQQGVTANAAQTPVISATTISTPVNEVPSSITVITSADLDQQQRRTVSDALQTVPGLNVVQTGAPGGLTSVYMRGTNANQVKVLIDGVDVSNPSQSSGAYDFGRLLTGDIERIEVLRGPQSGLYGSDAVGGVISIITKKGDGPAQAYASAEAGSFGTFNQATGVSGSTPGFNYAFNITHYRAENVPVTPMELVPPGQARLDDSYDNVTYSTKLGFDVSRDLTLNFVARYSDSTLHMNSGSYQQAPVESSQVDHQFSTRGEAVWSVFNGGLKNYFGLAYTDDWNRYNNPDPYYPSTTTWEGQRIKYDWRGVTEVAPGQVLLAGVERQNESMDLYPGSAKTGNSAAFIELQSEWAKRFFLVSNIRYDDNDSFGGATTYRIAPAYIVPGTETKLKASYGTGFKAPTLYQLYATVDYGCDPVYGCTWEIGNPKLRPEHSTGYDAGFEQPLFAGRVLFGATYFHNDVKDLINSAYSYDVPTNTMYYYYANVNHAEMYGAESFVSFQVTPEVKVRADYTYTIARDLDTGQELLRRPKDKVSFGAFWQASGQLKLSGTVNYVGPWADRDRATYAAITAPGYTTVNIAANYAATDRITLFGRIDNLFDRKYEDPSGFLRPGLGVFGGVKITENVADFLEPRK